MSEEHSFLALSTIRKNRGISLQEIAEATKISVRALEAIENGDFQKLPGGIYNTSYIRQYARAIDFDEGAILAAYHQKTGALGPNSPAAGNRSGKGMFGGYHPASTAI